MKYTLVAALAALLVGCSGGGDTTVMPSEAAVNVEPSTANITVEPAEVEVVIILDDNETMPVPPEVIDLLDSFKSEVIRQSKHSVVITGSIDYSKELDPYAFFVEVIYVDDDKGEDEPEFEKLLYNPIMEREGLLGRTLNFIQEVNLPKRRILYINILYMGESENVRLNLFEL